MRPKASDGKESSRAEKREHILECAARIFSERGVAEVTMHDIAAAAGVSKGALYLLFASKDELYLELVVNVARSIVGQMKEAVASVTIGSERARALLRSYARAHITDETKFHLAFGWVTSSFPFDDTLPIAREYRDIVLEAMQLSVAAIETGQQDGSIRPELDPARSAMQCWAAVVGLLLLAARGTETGSRAPQVDPALWSAFARDGANDAIADVEFVIDEFIDLLISAIEPRAAR